MSFVCPFCKVESHNRADAEQRYCGRCHVFVDDVLNCSPGVRRAMIKFHRRLMDRDPSKSFEALQQIQIWGHGLP